MERKIIKISLIIILIIIISIILYIGLIIFDTIRIHITEIELTNISQEEKEKLIEQNFLELKQYPESIKFLTLKSEKAIRETQYYITFSVSKEDANLYELERNTTRTKSN